MNKLSKVLVTIGIIFVFIVLFAIIVGVRGDEGKAGPGMLGTIIGIAAIGGIAAIWKKKE